MDAGPVSWFESDAEVFDVHQSSALPPGNQTAGCSPARIFDTLLFARMRADALVAAIELDIFSAIAAGAATVADLAVRCRASHRGLAALCNFLAVTGFLTKTGTAYGLADDTRLYLDRRSPFYCGGAAAFFSSAEMIGLSAGMAGCARRGGAASDEALVPDAPRWHTFAHCMAPVVASSATAMARRLGVANAGTQRVLDIAAGHGEYGIAIARANPLAHVTGLDWPGVLEVAAERARNAGLAARYRTLAGDAFEIEFGGPYDLVLLPNFLHCFARRECVAMLAKAGAALVADGRLAIVEFMPSEDRISPPWAAMFDLTMLIEFPSGQTYTYREHTNMLQAAGFGRIATFPLEQTAETLIVAIAD